MSIATWPGCSTAFESRIVTQSTLGRTVEFEEMTDLSWSRKETNEVTRAKDYYAYRVRPRMAGGRFLIDI